MLFDIRSPGRRMAVKGIYSALAILLGGGLILFGIGSGVSGGGLFDAISSDSGSLSDDAFVKKAEKQEQFVKTHPQDAAAYAQLARLRFQSADFDDSKGTFTTDGLKQLGLADQAWQRSIKLAGDEPDLRVANIMLNVYGPTGLNNAEKGVETAQLIVDSTKKPTRQQYAQLSLFAYLAQDERLGKLAGDKAVQLSDPDDREQTKAVIEQYKAAGTEAATQTTATP
jgi:hypothetical protein